jgi:hypothetical protein
MESAVSIFRVTGYVHSSDVMEGEAYYNIIIMMSQETPTSSAKCTAYPESVSEWLQS